MRIEEACKADFKQNPKLRFLNRLRYHALSPSGKYFGKRLISSRSQLLKSDRELSEAWASFWPDARRVLIDVYLNAEEQNTTMHALVRSSERWQQMDKRFELHTGI